MRIPNRAAADTPLERLMYHMLDDSVATMKSVKEDVAQAPSDRVSIGIKLLNQTSYEGLLGDLSFSSASVRREPDGRISSVMASRTEGEELEMMMFEDFGPNHAQKFLIAEGNGAISEFSYFQDGSLEFEKFLGHDPEFLIAKKLGV